MVEYNQPDRVRDVDRTVDIVIEAYVRAVSNYDTSLDTICSEIEAGIDLHPFEARRANKTRRFS